MTDPEAALGLLVQQALADQLGAEFATADPLIRPSSFADYQCNAAMSLATRLGEPPRGGPERVLAELESSPVVQKAEVSGPGFINLPLSASWIAEQANEQLADPRLGVARTDEVQHVVAD